MKNRFIYLLLLVIMSSPLISDERVTEVLGNYVTFLEEGTFAGGDYSFYDPYPKSRYYTFNKAFQHFSKMGGKVIVELGTSRSFVHGGLVGCNSNDTIYWKPNNPECWDWGAGFFTRMAAESLAHLDPEMHTVDLIADHINRCRFMTSDFSHLISYHVCNSINFLESWPAHKKIDLLYLDTGDICPIEPSAELQLAEALIIVTQDLIAPGGIILIDDVKHIVPVVLENDQTGMGKAKYSIPFLLANGFDLVETEFQYLLIKR